MKHYLFILAMLAASTLTNAQVKRTPATQQRTTTPAATHAFTLTNGKLGPIQTGQRFANIPATYAGLYDKYTYKKIEHEDDMDGGWTEEYYQFTKGGKNIFRVNIGEGKKMTGITLQEGSANIIKTQEGYYVGYPARTLYTKKRMEWTTYFEGTAFATSGHYTFHINGDDVVGNDYPTNVNQIKATAKITRINYSHEVYE